MLVILARFEVVSSLRYIGVRETVRTKWTSTCPQKGCLRGKKEDTQVPSVQSVIAGGPVDQTSDQDAASSSATGVGSRCH